MRLTLAALLLAAPAHAAVISPVTPPPGVWMPSGYDVAIPADPPAEPEDDRKAPDAAERILAERPRDPEPWRCVFPRHSERWSNRLCVPALPRSDPFWERRDTDPSPVPLPAAGLLLAAAVGAVWRMRRD